MLCTFSILNVLLCNLYLYYLSSWIFLLGAGVFVQLVYFTLHNYGLILTGSFLDTLRSLYCTCVALAKLIHVCAIFSGNLSVTL